MVMKPDVVYDAYKSVKSQNSKVIFLSPQGKKLDQKKVQSLAKESNLILLCGHYEGIDQRVIDEYVTDEITIGDYVLSSGETSTIVIIDALFRLIDGVITSESLEDESFNSGLLEYPQYTRPATYCNKDVPSVLLSGNHRHITEWRDCKRLEKTLLNRPDLLSHASLSIKERQNLLNIISKVEDDDYGHH